MTVLRAVWTAVAAALLLVGAGCKPGAGAAGDGKPVVLSTIFCYYDAARAIGGEYVDAEILLKPFASPHEYAATVHDKVMAVRSRLYIKNGLGIDDRFDKLLADSGARVLEIGKAVPAEMLVVTRETSLSGETEQAGAVSNPHIWLDPRIQMAAAEKIRDALAEMDPAHAAEYRVNAERYLAALRELDQQFAAAAAKFRTREFIGFHSAYDYLAHRYGLRQIASLEEVPGAGLSVAQARRIVKLIKEKHIRYIAVESALFGAGAKSIEAETGVRAIALQPLETYESRDESYVELMRENLQALTEALGGDV